MHHQSVAVLNREVAVLRRCRGVLPLGKWEVAALHSDHCNMHVPRFNCTPLYIGQVHRTHLYSQCPEGFQMRSKCLLLLTILHR